jgi:hypothetical protein
MKQTLTRLALTLPVVWLVVSLVFLLIHLVPHLERISSARRKRYRTFFTTGSTPVLILIFFDRQRHEIG